MKNFKFYLIIGVLFIFIIGLGKLYFNEKNKAQGLQNAKENVNKKIQTEAKEISRKVDEKGLETVLFDITNNKAKSPDDVRIDSDTKGIIDTTALALDIRTKQLKEVTVISAILKAENLQLKSRIDSLKRPFYTWSGNGLNLRFNPPSDSSSVATADINGRINLTAAQAFKKTWFLGKEKTLLSIKSDNPFITIDKVNYIGFDREPSPFNLEAKAKVNYNKIFGASSGPSLKIKLGKFDVAGDYQYYINNKSWTWGVSGSYSLVKF